MRRGFKLDLGGNNPVNITIDSRERLTNKDIRSLLHKLIKSDNLKDELEKIWLFNSNYFGVKEVEITYLTEHQVDIVEFDGLRMLLTDFNEVLSSELKPLPLEMGGWILISKSEEELRTKLSNMIFKLT